MKLENSFIVIPGFGEKTERKLWKKGVTHWDQVENTDHVTAGQRTKAKEFIEKARKNLEVSNTPFFNNQIDSKHFWRLYKNFEENACFYDIETTGLDKQRNKVTTVSFYRNGESKTLVRGQDLTAENLQKEIFESDIFVSFNGKRFDQPFLEHNFDVSFDKPHIDLMYPCKRIGLSGGLKPIEKEVGIARDDVEDVEGREAVRLWKKYEKNNDEAALEKLVLYNQYDAENLKRLLDHVHTALRKEVFEPHI